MKITVLVHDCDGEIHSVGRMLVDTELSTLHTMYADEHDIKWCMPPKECYFGNHLMWPEQVPSMSTFYPAVKNEKYDIRAYTVYYPLKKYIHSEYFFNWLTDKGYFEPMEYDEVGLW